MANGSVRISMYDVGFGDCFLLQIPTSDGLRKVLVDCGSIKRGVKPLSEVVAQLIEDVKESDGVPRIDVVIATHRHRDHVTGFADEAWKDVEVGEVWLPWTEDESDPAAAAIRERQLTLARRLERSLGFLPVADREALNDFAMNALTNEEAMKTLRSGFQTHKAHPPETKRHYLPDAALSRTLQSPALPGIEVSVMGPARTADVIAYLEPRSGDDHYLRLAGESSPSGANQNGRLFSSDWTSATSPAITPDERERLRKMGTGNEAALASWLDDALNNTSLMIMLKVRKAHILLPGDSQWGTWMRVLEDDAWTALLKRTTVYKVGHHGSYNATPPAFVEDCLDEHALSLISVIPHGSYKQVPKKELLDALRGEGRPAVRSDEPSEGASVFGRQVREGVAVDFEIPTT
jgi:beta-lactamase superfamily II metal-dependent hydrolase